jgi:hypothetical protein
MAALLALAAAWTSGAARAQTCASPITLTANNTYMGSTCDGVHVADMFCGSVPNPGPNTVFRFVVGSPLTGHLTLIAASASFAPVMFLMDGASPCDSAPCVAAGDTETPIVFDDLAPGEYWLIVAAERNSPLGACGEFALTNDASSPDSIFGDGFD